MPSFRLGIKGSADPQFLMLAHADHISLIMLGAQLLLNDGIGDIVQLGRVNCCAVRVGALDVVRSHGAKFRWKCSDDREGELLNDMTTRGRR